ncbi:MAG: DUF92 domain-containing protein [Calditrichaeota bacterium]|nr:MAG: DUF92 domain-containing protein [Calditrichota bacterium]
MTMDHLFSPVPARDWWITLGLVSGILAVVFLAEALRHRRRWPEEVTRKFVHVAVGVLTVLAPLLLSASLPPVLMGVLFTGANLMALRKGRFRSMHGSRHSYGTVFYPLAFLLLVPGCWPAYRGILILAMLVLALADAAAAMVGESVPRPHTFRLLGDAKSLEGSAAMFAVTAAVVFAGLRGVPFPGTAFPLDIGSAAMCALTTAAVATVAEALSSRGSDNLSVPLFTALMLYVWLTQGAAAGARLTSGVLLGALTAGASLRVGFLSPSGAAAAFLLATVVFGLGGWTWAVPILVFFIPSSLLSRVGSGRKALPAAVFEKGSRRDFGQVLANGGVAGGLVILHLFFPAPVLYGMYVAALAAAGADTWATELGILSPLPPRRITTGRRVPPGTSGGVTAVGLLGGLGGAAVVALSGWGFMENGGWVLPAAITVCGFIGSLVDSLVGATLQAQYRCPVCGRITEKAIHCADAPAELISGHPRLTNDGVNFICTLSGALCWAAVVMFVC